MATNVKKEVATNPSGNAVVAPNDTKQKNADIDRKMRFYGVIEAFRQGSYPSNQQIDETLRYVEGHSPVDESKLSKEGKKLIQDVRDIIAIARKMVAKKNEDELFQNFLYHSRHVDTDKVNPAKQVGTSVTKDDVKQDGEQAAEHLRTLGKLIFTNAEFRKILKDVGLIARDAAADAAVKTADVARPPQEALDKVDETAPSNRWYGPEGQVHGPNDAAPDTGLGDKVEKAKSAAATATSVKEDAKAHAKDAASRAQSNAEGKPSDEQGGAAADAVADKGRELADQVPDEHKQRANEVGDKAQAHADDAKRRVDSAVASADGPHSGVPRDAEGAQNLTEDEQRAAKEAGKTTAKEKVKAVIPEEHREKVSQKVDETKDYLKEKVPKERRDRFIYRLKKVVVEQQRHRDYQEAIDFFLGLFENYKGHAKDVHAQTVDHAQSNVRGDPAYSKAELELRTLVERFANNTSAQPIVEAIATIYDDVQNDAELQKWFTELDRYVRRVLQEPGFVMKDKCDEEGRRLRDNAKGFFSERYRPHREALITEVQNFFTSFADDPLNKQFGEAWKTLTKDLLLDGDGNFKYKSHLWNDVRAVILPELFSKVGYVPIPRMEYTDAQIDLVIENLTLEGSNLLPNIFEIEARTYHKLSPYTGITNKSKQSVWIQFSQIQSDLRDVAFYFKKKSGFPRLSDRGLADVFIGGNGITGKVHLETSSNRGSVFDVREIKVKIDTLKFKIRDSKHDLLYGFVRPLATSLIKKEISKAVQDAIRSGLGALNAQLVEVRDRLDEAKEDEDTSRVDVLKNVFNEKKQQGADKAREADDKTGTFQLVAKRDSKIIDWESKNSMVAKQAEREKAAGKGTGWKSPAFDILPGQKTDVSTKSKGIDGASNVPTHDFKKANPEGAGVVAAAADKVGHGDKGPAPSQQSSGASSAGQQQNGSVAPPPQQQRETAAGAVSGGALNSAPLAASAAGGAGSGAKVSPPNQTTEVSPAGTTANSGLAPALPGASY